MYIVFRVALWLWFATGWRWTKGPLGWSAGRLLREEEDGPGGGTGPEGINQP